MRLGIQIALFLLLAGASHAISITGATEVAAPAELVRDAFDVDSVFYFAEAEEFTLEAALELDDGTVIAAGTVVDSYYVIYDPPVRTWLETTLEFDIPILGFVSLGSELRGTDFLGAPTTDYGRFSHRGFESAPGTSRRDSIDLAADRFSLDFLIRANSPGDALRIITPHVAAPIPEPTTAWLLGLGLAALGRLRKRRPAVA